jgi:hypothetical protein
MTKGGLGRRIYRGGGGGDAGEMAVDAVGGDLEKPRSGFCLFVFGGWSGGEVSRSLTC